MQYSIPILEWYPPCHFPIFLEAARSTAAREVFSSPRLLGMWNKKKSVWQNGHEWNCSNDGRVFIVIFEIIWDTFKGWACVQPAEKRKRREEKERRKKKGKRVQTSRPDLHSERRPLVFLRDRSTRFPLRVHISRTSTEYSQVCKSILLDGVRKISIGYFLLNDAITAVLFAKAPRVIDASLNIYFFFQRFAYLNVYLIDIVSLI